jgi:hypothetical protein
MHGEISFISCSLSLKRTDNVKFMAALSTLRLIECNPHVKRLKIEDDADTLNYSNDARMISYLSQQCPKVTEISMYTPSTEAVRLAMESFPNIANISWNRRYVDEDMDPIGATNSFPNIKSFKVLDRYNHDDVIATINACPNLTSLDCGGPSLYRVMKKIMTSSCNNLNF